MYRCITIFILKIYIKHINGYLFKSLDPHYCRATFTCGTSLVTHRWSRSDYFPLIRD